MPAFMLRSAYNTLKTRFTQICIKKLCIEQKNVFFSRHFFTKICVANWFRYSWFNRRTMQEVWPKYIVMCGMWEWFNIAECTCLILYAYNFCMNSDWKVFLREIGGTIKEAERRSEPPPPSRVVSCLLRLPSRFQISSGNLLMQYWQSIILDASKHMYY